MLGLSCILLILTLSAVVSSDNCTNYVMGKELTIECPGGCCVDGGSYSIVLNEDDVCRKVAADAVDASCEKVQSLPTSCPVVINGIETMYGCGVGERCCFANKTNELFFEFEPPHAYDVCSKNRDCYMGAEEFYERDFMWSDTRDRESQLCYYAMQYGDSNVIIDTKQCSGQQSCCFRNYTFLDEKTHGFGEGVGVCEEKCGEKIDEITDTCVYKLYDDEFYSSVSCYNGDKCCAKNYTSKMHPGLRVLCASGDSRELACSWRDDEYDAFYIPYIPEECDCDECDCDDEEGLAAWAIALIVLVIIILLVASCLLFVWMTYKHKFSAVRPKDVETPVIEEIVIDERAIRRAEIEEYLDHAITKNDMADLKLAIDMTEHHNLQDELSVKYNKAKGMLEELLRRSEEEKRRELEELERQAELEKKKLEEAEAELERKRKQAEADEAAQAALLEAQRKRDEANKRWNRMWPRLNVLRAINDVNESAMAKAMEDARKQKEEEDRIKREAEEKQRKLDNCKKLLEHGISSQNEDKLITAIDMTEKSGFHAVELKDLYNKAKEDLERLRQERERKEREASEKKEKEEKEAAEKKAKERAAAMAKIDGVKKALQTGIDKRDIKLLKSAIDDVEKLSLEDDMLDEYKKAKDLLARLEKIEKIKRAIQELKRPLIAELKSFSDPPEPVYKAMVAAYMLMGESKKDLEKWSEVQILLNKTGKLSVKRRVQERNVEDVSLDLAGDAEEVIKGLTSDEVYEANQAASLFFDWTEMICYERKQLSTV